MSDLQNASRRVRRAGVALGTAIVATLGLCWTLGGAEANRAGARTQPLDWGLYQILWSREYDRHIRETLEHFESKPRYVMFYRDLGRKFPKRPIDAIDAVGATTLVSLELWSWHGGRKGGFLPAINAGEYDEFFRAWAVEAKKDGRRVLLRFGFEFNGDWFTWSLDPKAYVAAWRRIRSIFDEVGASNVEWVWAPNIVSCPDKPENNMHLYYPGDKVVEWVALDGYNFGDHHDKWHRWQSFEDVYAAVLADFARRYPTKPLIISEFGSAPGKPGQRATWIRDAHRFLERHPQVKAAIWFHLDKRREGEPNWKLTDVTEDMKAFNETFAAPR